MRRFLLAALLSSTATAFVTHVPRRGNGVHTCRTACTVACENDRGERGRFIAGLVGFGYLGNFVAVVSLGVLSRLGLISLPPINTLTDIANNAMEAEIAAGTLQPLLATGWATAFWFDLIRQQYEFDDATTSFVASYCTAHANLCEGVVY